MRRSLRSLGILLLAGALAPRPALAGGTTAASFLQMDLGARSLGMASAFSGLADDYQAFYHNPAGLTQLKRGEVGLDYVRAPLGLGFHRFVYARPLDRSWAMAVGIDYMRSEPIPKLDAAGATLGMYNTTGLVAGLSVAKHLGEGLRFGVTGKMVRQTLDTLSETSPSFDAGLLYKQGDLRLGVVVKDVGPDFKLGTQAAPLPRTIKFGASHEFTHDYWNLLTLSAEGRKTRFEDLQGAVAGEVRLPGSGVCTFLAMRLGYKVRGLSQSGGSNFTGGFGVRIIEDYDIDLAYLPYGNAGDLLSISLSARLGPGRAP